MPSCLVVEGLRHRGVRLVRPGRRDRLVLVVDARRRAERLLEPARPARAASAATGAGCRAPRRGCRSVGAPVISWSISAIGNSGARSSGPTGSFVPGMQRRLQRLGQVGQRVEPGGRDLVLGEHEAGVHHDLRFTGAAPRSRTRRRSDRRRARGLRRRARRRTLRHRAGPRRRACGRATRRPRPRRRGCARPSDSPHAEVLRERREVAVVDADDRRRPPRAPARARRSSCASTSTARPRSRASACRSREQRVVGQRGDDEQDRVGADRAGLVDLELVDREVLAQHRERGRVAGGGEVVDRARRSTGASVSTDSAAAPPAS